MKKKLCIALFLLLALTAAAALASVEATPNQKLAFRTGPNREYVWLYNLSKSTSIRAIEYEKGNGVTWVLVEYEHDGFVCRAYTGLKRMSVHGDIPWAIHENRSCRVDESVQVFAAPTERGAYRGYLYEGEWITLLRYEGDYAFIEFSDDGTPSRGYVKAWAIDDADMPSSPYDDWDAGVKKVPATPNQKLYLRTGPNRKYIGLYNMPQSTSIQAIEYEKGNGVTWVLVEYQRQGFTCRGYTGLKRMSVDGDIPWANHLDESVRMAVDATVLAAPTERADYRGTVRRGEWVQLLRYEGDYAFIEFSDGGTPSRGYVEADQIE